MIIKPKMRGFICTTSHPVGCAKAVEEQINFVKSKDKFDGPKNVLVIGGSTGYGLASRISATYGSGAKTIGVFFEKEPANNRTGSAGWYNTAALEKFAHADGYYARSINGDAFSNAIKTKTIDLIKKDLGKIDLIVYSLASPKRTHPLSGEVYSSALKPINQSFTSKTVDPLKKEIKEISIEPASDDEIKNTIAVMGGEDWNMWIDLLGQENLLADGVVTLAYDYIGPNLTHSIYKNGTIGKAKENLLNTALILNNKLKKLNGKALLSVNKALVTQASAAIPVVPLYISLLYKIMKEKNIHEGCIDQINRLFKDKIYNNIDLDLDDQGRVRMDDLEMRSDVQDKIIELWGSINSNNLDELTDIDGYINDFHQLFGFNFKDVDYSKDISPEVNIPSLSD
ncbi:trans-2-enoyl-CoA reductase family protein [Gammaproteobacteria bacterium]|nr:trans-2-enoyl-CoA reductase family protein [Gammaproteobacteria bacterium]